MKGDSCFTNCGWPSYVIELAGNNADPRQRSVMASLAMRQRTRLLSKRNGTSFWEQL
jgi:hypothetical protein